MAFQIRYEPVFVWFFSLLGVGPRHSSVELDATTVHVRMGWAFRAHVPLRNVVGARRISDVWWAIGVHTTFNGRWIVNGSPSGMVSLDIEPPVRAWTLGIPIRPRRLDLSLVDPEGFLAAIARSTRKKT